MKVRIEGEKEECMKDAFVGRKTFIFFIAIIFFCFSLSPAQNTASGQENDLELEALLNVKVSVASKKAENISDAPGIIYVVSQDEIRRTGAVSFKELLLRIPSLGIATNATTNRSIVVMRGDLIKINSSHILFLIDGRPIREVQEGGVSSDLIESFPVDIIEQIEVIRGPGSVLYGSDAFSGVINIKTRKPIDKPFSASVTGHIEPMTGGGVSGDVLLKSGDLDVEAAFRDYQKPELKENFNQAYFYFDMASFRFVTSDSLVRDDIVFDQGPGVFLSANYKGLSATGSFVQWKNSSYQNGADVTNHKFFGNAGYKKQIRDNWKTETNITGTRTELFTVDPRFIERHSNNFLLENTHFITFLKNLGVVLGGTMSYIEGYEKNLIAGVSAQSTGTVYSIGNRVALSAYGQADYTIFDQVKLIGGVQGNKTRNIPAHFAPRLGAIWHPIKEISIKTFYSEAFRLPSINELYINYNIGIYGDSTLRPEIMKTIDAGVSYQNDQVMIGVNYFHSIESDIIQQELFNQANFDFYSRKYMNLGTVTFDGAELEGKMYVTKQLYLNGSLLYQHSKDSLYDSVVPYPDFGGKAGVSYAFPQGITLSLSDAYQGHLPDKFKGTNNKSRHDANINEHIDGMPFSLINFSSQFNLAKLFNKKFKIEPSLLFKIDNLIGKEIWMYEYGGFSNDVVPTIRGREFFLGLNLSL
jgi:outer membrane receptor for ferrienterochelin and colicins